MVKPNPSLCERDSMRPAPFRIDKIRSECADTFTLELQPTNGSDRLVFAPGQFNMLYVFGIGEVPISISGDPAKPLLLKHTTRMVGAVTRAMCRLNPGATIGIRGPFGNPWPVAEAKGSDVLIVAGGIGLAPLRPALYAILAEREKYGRVVLLYGARAPEEILFEKEIRQWRGLFDLDVMVTVDRATGRWRGNVGVVTRLIPRAPIDPYHTKAMVCGPEIMMRYTLQELEKRGLKPDDIYISMERNMKCGIGLCGHCQCGPFFMCKDGPVMRFDRIAPVFGKVEV